MPVDQRPDEEALALTIPGHKRKALGAFYTPAPLVEVVLASVARWIPADRPVAVIDPACGAGAFLSAAARHLPTAALYGLELTAEAAEMCRGRLPRAEILEGDALRGGLDALCARIPAGHFELWVGNPPYNGTSNVLRDAALYRSLRELLPADLPRGQSLRDDYAFFLLLAARRIHQRGGALAFVTSATLLDAYLYAPVRRFLVERLALREVIELGAGVFRGTRVRTAVTVWTQRASPAGSEPRPRYRRRRDTRDAFGPDQLLEPVEFPLEAPELLLRPTPPDAAALEARWRADGEALTSLLPVSTPGLKTRFDELLVDDDPERLLERVRAFVACTPEELEQFADAYGLDRDLLPKLRALRAFTQLRPEDVTPDAIRPFHRYAGARHRGTIPESAQAFCYLDRQLIPRGDHRLRGAWDPHACDVKLVFNVRELPLSAALLDRPGCVHDHRHARFAPLYVPRRILEEGPASAGRGGLGEDVPNLSPRGRTWASALGGPRPLLEALVRFINSAEVQDRWAPTFGASRELHVTFDALLAHAKPGQT
ncbi:MAG: N-6 DNA methylase [Myxococcaceae bacterium]